MRTQDVDFQRILDIGIALSGEKDYDRLLEKILRSAMDITRADAGTLYICGGGVLTFRIMITKSMGYFKGGKGDPIDLPPVPLNPANVCARTALEKRLYNIPDVYDSTDFDFSGPRKYDSMTGYRTKSMLCVPMENDYGDIIGVLQLINSKDGDGNSAPFLPDYEKIVAAIASQAGICLTNMNYNEEVEELLYSFVRVMVTGIEARTPYNANHTKNMVQYASAFIDWLNSADRGWSFDDSARQQLLMSVWLHDVGKLVIPTEVMDKSTRLGSLLQTVESRYEKYLLGLDVLLAGGRMQEKHFCTERDTALEELEFLRRINEAGYLADEDAKRVADIGFRAFSLPGKEDMPRLTAEELEKLSIRKGTLTAGERKIMESHVTMTETMLGEMHFPRNYRRVPEWAACHHEMLNGRGYPKGLSDGEIPPEVRLITILDIYDALTARDRPYKKPMPTEKAFSILRDMASGGQLDTGILEMFIESGAWK